MSSFDATHKSVRELLDTLLAISSELRRRGYTRTGTSVAGELMEHVVANAYAARLEAPVNAGWDAITDGGTRIQVKTRFLEPGQNRSYTFKNLDFDLAVVAWIDATTFQVEWAREITRAELEPILAKHSTGYRLSPLRARTHGRDITDTMRETFDRLV